MKKDSVNLELATLGGGCFWCTEAVMIRLEGVYNVQSGYAGGQGANPSYEAVSTGRTGHAEVIQIQFDPTKILYRELLEIFFATHDPTTLNRQGHDVGSQYRSIIFYHTNKQKVTAQEVIADFTKQEVFPNPIVTELQQYEHFYPAESYHEDYYRRNPDRAYCRVVITPKVLKLRKLYLQKLKPKYQSTP
jgi:peptide-methionine (S)-S-oxide reductase